METTLVFIGASLVFGLAVLLLVYYNFTGLYGWCRRRSETYLAVYRRHYEALFLPFHPVRFAALHLGASLLLPLPIAVVTGRVFLPIAVALLTFYWPRLTLARRVKKRRQRLDLQLMDALGLMANALKAGLTLTQSLGNVIRQMNPPITDELSLLMREYRLGLTLDEALINFSQRVPSTNVSIFVSSILIARRSGGNIALVLERMGESMKEIYRLENKIDAVTSQGKAQGFVLSLLPAFLGIMLYLLDKTMILPLLTTPQGYVICFFIAILWAIGIFFIWKIVTVEV